MQNDRGILYAFAKATAQVSDAIGFILGSLVVGYLLDAWFVKTKPWITVGMVFLGIFIGFYRLIKKYQKNENE